MVDEASLPGLNSRAQGWLRYIWDKATTEDDWSSKGEPLPWWDKTTTPPMCSFPRFDLSETSYSLPLMADQTPAWREIYTRIADELVGRYTSFWAAADWLTLIGPDPHRDRYPPDWLVWMPEKLRGKYEPPGWTGNGMEPWGMQPDPIAADGNLFFRGFFNLLLGTYSYVSGDDKWEKPFQVTGYNDRLFQWNQHTITEFIKEQWVERPQGAHCENTKVWPYCLSAAGLGLQLYDKLFQSKTHEVYDEWIEFAKLHFTERNSAGDIKSFAFYYDPIESVAYSPPSGLSGYGMLAPLFYMLPQAPEFGTELYEAGIRDLGWNDRTQSIVQGFNDPRWICIVLMLARELGDVTTERRLKSLGERLWGANFFEDDDRFAWRFGLQEKYPRSQLNGLLILSEIGQPGAWSKVYKGKKSNHFFEPTVVGVDFPNLGINRAVNDPEESKLYVSTYAATKSEAKRKTSWKVSNLKQPESVTVYLDNTIYSDWSIVDGSTIEINTVIGSKNFCISYKPNWAGKTESSFSSTDVSQETASFKPESARNRKMYTPAAPPSCSCC